MKNRIIKFANSKTGHFVIFTGLFLGLFFLYDFDHILFLRPQGIHSWRQCDCASFALNYSQEGMDFFQPKIHYSGGDGTGKTASDFPLLYYFNAFLWNIFGYHEYTFRIINLLIFFVGLWFLSRSIGIITDDYFSGILLSVFLFTSPVLAYYANNFLMNLPAFGFALIGLYFFIKFYKSGRNIFLWLSMLLYTIGGLLKIPALCGFVAFFCIFLLDATGLVKFIEDKTRIFKKPLIQIVPFVFTIIVVFTWYKYAIWYNKQFNSGIFLTDIWPIWKISKEKFEYVIENVWVIQSTEYFHRWVQFIAVLLLVSLLIFNKKVNRFLLATTIFLSLGTLSFVTLWFGVLDHHDYYIINQFITLVFIYITALHTAIRNFEAFKRKWILPFIILLALIPSSIYAKKMIKDRYLGWKNEQYVKYFKKLENITPYLRSIGINREDKVISIPDKSFNISLYLMDQKGYTNFAKKGKDSLSISNLIREMGCKYLIINDTTILSQPYLKYFLETKKGEFEGVFIYDLQNR